MHKIPLSDQVNRFVTWSNEQDQAPVDMTAAPAQAMIVDIDSLLAKLFKADYPATARDVMLKELCSGNTTNLKCKLDSMHLQPEICFYNEQERKLQVANILGRLFQLPIDKRFTRADSSPGLATLVKTLLVKPSREAFDKRILKTPGDKLGQASLIKAISLLDANLVIAELMTGFNVDDDFDTNIRTLTLLSQLDLKRNCSEKNLAQLRSSVTVVLRAALRSNDDEDSELLINTALRILGNIPDLKENPNLLVALESIIYVNGYMDYDPETVKLALRALANMQWKNNLSYNMAEQLKAHLQSPGFGDEAAIRDYTTVVLSKISGYGERDGDMELISFALDLFGDEYLMSESAQIAKSTALAIRALANSHPTVMDEVQEKLKEMTSGRSIDAIHSPALYSLITSLLDQDCLEQIVSETCNPRLGEHVLAAREGKRAIEEDHFGNGSPSSFYDRLEGLLKKPKGNDCADVFHLLALMNKHSRLLKALQDPRFIPQYHQIAASLIGMGPRIVPDLLTSLEEFSKDTDPETIRLLVRILAAIVTKPALLLDKVHLQQSTKKIQELSFQKLANLDDRDYDSLDWERIVRTLVDFDSSSRDPQLHDIVYKAMNLNRQFCRKPLIELCSSDNESYAQAAENVLFEIGYTRNYIRHQAS
ncbi:MAG: hypothetical protein HOA17_01755 [Candidatus Melainabacteria bacterium]|jgi:hypothetical protein|nr:hypothetical protein [Candidatus Melainabacteria bacterium]